MYKVGDVVWKASCYWGGEHVPCPVCFGDKVVIVVLGNKNRVLTECKCCKLGYCPPTGTVKSYGYIARPVQHRVTEVRTTKTEEGESVEYLAGNNILYANSTFGTEEAAMEKCEELAMAAERSAINALRHKKKEAISHAIYSIGYHRGEVTRLKKEVARHEAAIIITKEEKK
jgi:hypothetical protein